MYCKLLEVSENLDVFTWTVRCESYFGGFSYFMIQGLTSEQYLNIQKKLYLILSLFHPKKFYAPKLTKLFTFSGETG